MPVPVLDCPEGPSDTGAYRLSWSGPEGVDFRLKEDDATIYEGPNRASAVSGRLEGSYTYEVGVVGDAGVAWSKPCEVEVAPPSLGLAIAMFAIGFSITVATVGVVVRGHRAHRRGEIG